MEQDKIFSPVERIRNRCLYVTGFPEDTEEEYLLKYFQNFGPVKKITVKCNGRYAFVTYFNQNSAETALSNRHVIRNRQLVVQIRKIPRSKSCQPYWHHKPDVTEEMHERLIKQLSLYDSVPEQMVAIQNLLSLSNKSLRRRHIISKHLQRVLVKYFPNCTVHLFGSSVNGFGFEGCDVDMILNISRLNNDGYEPFWTVNAPSLEEIEKHKVSIHQLNNMAKVKLIQKIIQQYVVQCQNICFVPSLRCPLLRFQYIYENYILNCDFSLGEGLCLRNTALLQMYRKIDSRVAPLITTLRYWGKYHSLIGSGDERKLTSYAFLMLTIYFLQTRKPKVIPTVQQLCRLSDTKDIVNGWDCSFCRDPKTISPSKNTQSLEELLQEFFQFYANFDFLFKIICPRTGETIDKETFFSQSDNKFKITPISIQDPFDLHHNVGATAKILLFEQFMQKLQNSTTICKNENYLEKLLQPYDLQEKTKVGKIPSFRIKLNYLILEHLIRSAYRLHLKSKIIILWVKNICSLIHNIFNVALCGKCHVFNNCFDQILFENKCSATSSDVSESYITEAKNKFQRLSDDLTLKDGISTENFQGFEISDYSNQLLLHLGCKVRSCIYINRKRESKEHISEKTDILEVEREITEKIIKKNCKEDEYFEMDCLVLTKSLSTFPEILVEIHPQSKECSKNVASFLKLYLSKLVDKYMKTAEFWNNL
ncbi:poly(A) RNA polymerase, mitochondrial-like isoform X1 [Centruroides vittatus]|uniref:poly(A) RNA polymerase, mitochondrial-like isoform X1 n=1 Tax=Centruroides vittatus TaxID=120091 RepID=UPI00351072CF